MGEESGGLLVERALVECFLVAEQSLAEQSLAIFLLWISAQLKQSKGTKTEEMTSNHSQSFGKRLQHWVQVEGMQPWGMESTRAWGIEGIQAWGIAAWFQKKKIASFDQEESP